MGNGSKLLIVDDEKLTLENLEYFMSKEGYEVTVANSGTEALKILEKKDVDVVLTDLRMQGVDGMGVLGKCKELYPNQKLSSLPHMHPCLLL